MIEFDVFFFSVSRSKKSIAIFSCPGSTPLHLAARGGSLDCIRELLAWGADRLHRDASGYSAVSQLNFLPLRKRGYRV